MRIGVISDTHVGGDGHDLPEAVLRAFHGLDLILHCGDLDASTGVLDYLETVAPVKAVRGYPDPREEGDRLAETTRVVQVEDMRIGMIHDIEGSGPPIRFHRRIQFPPGDIKDILIRKFGEAVDIVAFGHSHEERIALYQGVLFINPGSPTRPATSQRVGAWGTVGLLEIENGVVTAEIVHLRP